MWLFLFLISFKFFAAILNLVFYLLKGSKNHYFYNQDATGRGMKSRGKR